MTPPAMELGQHDMTLKALIPGRCPPRTHDYKHLGDSIAEAWSGTIPARNRIGMFGHRYFHGRWSAASRRGLTHGGFSGF
jgi:hypothetical protein